MTSLLRRSVLAAVALGAAVPASAGAFKPGDDPASSAVWQKVRASLFDNRPIAAAPADMLTLEAPARAVDAAVVPIALRTRLPAGASVTVSKLYLVIDANPSPISAVFQFGPASARADVETRVRVDDYSHVRAIAETSDGKLYMTTRFVRASGGCSAPAGADAAAAQASLGKMQWRIEGDAAGTAPLLTTLAISHPNHSGLAMDQVTRHFIPPHYVRKIDVSYGGQSVLTADVDFSMSENPNFRFWVLPQGGKGELKATVVDTRDLRFVAAQQLGDAR